MANIKLFEVGGSVRDQMLAIKDIKDIDDTNIPIYLLEKALEIQKEGEYEFNGKRLIINKTNEMVKSKNPFVEIIDRRLLSKKSLKLRTWRAGARFKPLGMNGNK